jgi:two-component system, sensor histidine kinase PdtaS
MRLKWEPADTVIALCGVLLLVVFAIFGVLVWQGYDATVAQAETKAQTAADIIAEEITWALGASQSLLDHIAADLEGQPSNLRDPLREQFDMAASKLTSLSALAYYDAAGDRVGQGGPADIPPTISGTDYFATLRAGETWAISPQFRTTPDSAAYFAIARRLADAGGFNGAAILFVQGQLLQQFWSPQALGDNSTASIARDDGWIVARHPELETALNLGALPIFETILNSDHGTYLSPKSPADGESRVVAFRHLPRFGLVAIASISQDAILAGLWSAVRTVLFLMGPIAIALLIGSFVTARILRQSESTRRTLSDALVHNEALFREIHHRVKNNLQSVNSLLRLQPIPADVKREMGQRIAAMSAVHEHIYRTNNFITVDAKEYLHTLVENIRASQSATVEIVEDLDVFPVDRDSATPIGLIFNEVVSNAFKHAFSADRHGVLTISLKRDADGMGRLVVKDNGAGFDPAAPSKGIGRRLIEAFTEQIGGRSEWNFEEGARFVLTFPPAGRPHPTPVSH